ncbi:PAAR domain-containing protein [Micromonospora sp. STR1s_5]|nr:PAAR domain-containing protein [Micromonospora sp. STR1s_5]
MPTGPAARINDMTVHGSPLVPGPPSSNVFIGGQPAWLGMTAAAAAALTKAITDGLKDVAEKTAANTAAAGTPAATKTAKDLLDAQTKLVDDATSLMAGGMSINVCPLFPLPHVQGVVIAPSQTVFINGWGACRVGDTIQEVTAVNAIATGLPTVIIGG